MSFDATERLHVHVVDSPDDGILQDHLDQDSLIELATDHRRMPADADVFRMYLAAMILLDSMPPG